MASQEINFSKFDFSTKANKTYLSFLLEILGAWFRNCGSLCNRIAPQFTIVV
jgi:hypothetical protein